MQKIIVRSVLALILVAAAAGIAWQLFGDRMARGSGARNSGGERAAAGDVYYCPMHKNYTSDKPGNCPICGMQLVKKEKSETAEKKDGQQMPAMPGMTAAGGQAPPSTGPTIFVPPRQQQLIGVRTATAEYRTLAKEIRTVGKVSIDESRVTHIHSKVSGWIEHVSVDYVGKYVARGDPLFTLYSPDLVATEEEYLLALRARKELASSSFDRVSAGAANLVEAARRRLELWDVTEDEITRLEREGKARREITVYSPASGVVTERAAYHHGRYVTPELDLYTIVDLSRVWVLGDVYEFELPLVRQGQRVEVDMPYEPDARSLVGTVTFVYPYLNPTTRTGQIRIEFPNPGQRLKPDMFVNLKLGSSLGRQLVVPEDAVLDSGTVKYVFVDKGEGYFEPREVETGGQAQGYYAIRRGLRPGEKVATGANFLLDSESRLKGALAGMGKPSSEIPRMQTPAQQLRIALRSEPEPARVGENLIRVQVADPGGAPITDASVRVRIFMAAMGSMAPMSSEAALAHQGNGEYTGRLNVPMAWTWQTTVTVERQGKVIGSAQMNLRVQ
jgi:RND family efflux transporter MFP subunit